VELTFDTMTSYSISLHALDYKISVIFLKVACFKVILLCCMFHEFIFGFLDH
jgi:hypothetical protein